MNSGIKAKLFSKSFSLKSSSKTFIDAPTAQGSLARCARFLAIAATLACGAAVHAGDVLLDKLYDAAGEHVFIVPDGVTELDIEAVGGGGQGTYWEGWGAPEIKKHTLGYSYHRNQGWLTGAINIPGRSRVKHVTLEHSSFDAYTYDASRYENWRDAHNYLKFGESCEIPKDEARNFVFSVKYRGGDWWRLFDLYLQVEHWETKSTPGCRGQFARLNLNNLNGGDEVKIRVGAGGKDGDGEDTIVSVNGVEVMRAAGGKRECDVAQVAAPEGFTAHYGNGGQGGASQGEAGQPGGSGAVKVSWLMPDVNALMGHNMALVNEINIYKMELIENAEHVNKRIEQCVEMACEKDPALKEVIKNLRKMHDASEVIKAQLWDNIRRFDAIFYPIYFQTQEMKDVVVGAGLLTSGDTNMLPKYF